MPLSLGTNVIPFSLPGIDGKEHTPDDYKDAKILAVAWWCNHCPSVQKWEQRTIDLANAFKDRGVQFVMISSNDVVNYPTDSFDHMKERAGSKGYPFPYLFDETQETARAYEAERTPEFFVFDADRVLRYHGRLDDNRDDPRGVTKEYMKDALNALLEDKEPPLPETPPKGCSVKWKLLA